MSLLKKDIISIIIPSYNSERYISECIESALSQEVGKEIIIINDGSADHSPDIIREYSERSKEIRVVDQPNCGASAARNAGIACSEGRYIYFLDSDDVLYPGSLGKLKDFMESEELDIALGNVNRLFSDGSLMKKSFYSGKQVYQGADIYRLAMDIPVPSNKLYKRSLISRGRIRFGNCRIGEDLNFFLKCLSAADRAGTIETDIYKWREVRGSLSDTLSLSAFSIRECFEDLKKYYIQNGIEDRYRKYIVPMEFKQYYLQMERISDIGDKRLKKLFVAYFSYLISGLELKESIYGRDIDKDIRLYKLKMAFKPLYQSSLYGRIKHLYMDRKKRETYGQQLIK